MAPQAEKGTNRIGDPDSANVGFMEPEVHARVFIAEMLGGIALAAESNGDSPKHWAVDSGCTNHFCPYKSDFITYKCYNKPGSVHVGDD